MRIRNDRRGFSLVEMAVVVLVAGLIMAIGIPGLNRLMTTNNLRDSGRILVGEMKLARQRAVTNGQRAWVWYATGGSTYWTGTQTQVGGVWGATVWKGPFALPKRVRIQGVDFSGDNFFWYAPDGRPSSSGSVLLFTTVLPADSTSVNLDLTGSVWQ
jgi:prepilin-type N-terminal cleavage/methylation domain-containing protein